MLQCLTHVARHKTLTWQLHAVNGQMCCGEKVGEVSTSLSSPFFIFIFTQPFHTCPHQHGWNSSWGNHRCVTKFQASPSNSCWVISGLLPIVNPLWCHPFICGLLFWSLEFGNTAVTIFSLFCFVLFFWGDHIWTREWSWGGYASLRLYPDCIWLRTRGRAVIVTSITRQPRPKSTLPYRLFNS